jgi:hypothetical protein
MRDLLKAILLVLITVLALVFTGCGGDSSDDTPAKTYAIGDTGPSGVGIVFYITDGGLHGLEAAPENWNPNGSGDPKPAWITGGNTQTTPNYHTLSAIGTGFANSNFIISQSEHTNSAANVCREYTGSGKTDWFLPSTDELRELYLQKAAVGDFETGYYWASTEDTFYTGGLEAYCYSFDEPNPLYAKKRVEKNTLCYARPVRAF